MPHKLQNILDKILWGAGVITIGLILGIGIQFAIAAIWTGPTSAPPNDNVSAPINTGANQQLKGNFSSHIGSVSLAGVLETFGFKMPTGAQPGYVLTAQDANGQAAWAAGGGGACWISYKYGCSGNNCCTGKDGTITGFINKGSVGKWGTCSLIVSETEAAYTFFPPDAAYSSYYCKAPSSYGVNILGEAYLCCQ